MKIEFAQSLKAILMDELRVKKIISRKEIKKIASKNGYEESAAERRFRAEKNPIPCIKLNGKKKPIFESEKIEWYRWNGGKTIFRKNYEEKKRI